MKQLHIEVSIINLEITNIDKEKWEKQKKTYEEIKEKIKKNINIFKNQN